MPLCSCCKQRFVTLFDGGFLCIYGLCNSCYQDWQSMLLWEEDSSPWEILKSL